MKRTLVIIFVIFIIIMSILFMNFKNIQKNNLQINKLNKEYEFYNKEELYGVDVTTVINKAIDNNEKYGIEKDSSGMYISDDENSIKIYITMIINKKTYPMEKIKQIGMEAFTESFGEVKFKCTDIKYHKKTGKLSEMTFESTQY